MADYEYHLVQDQNPPPGPRKARLELRNGALVVDSETFTHNGTDLGNRMDAAILALKQRLFNRGGHG